MHALHSTPVHLLIDAVVSSGELEAALWKAAQSGNMQFRI